MKMENDTKRDRQRRALTLAGLVAPIDVVAAFFVGHVLAQIGTLPAWLPWWAFGGLLAVALIVAGVLELNWLYRTMGANMTPIDVDWDADALTVHLPAIAGGASAPPREVNIPWPQVSGVSLPGLLRPGSLSYSKMPSATGPPSPGRGGVLILSSSVATQLAEAYRRRGPGPSTTGPAPLR